MNKKIGYYFKKGFVEGSFVFRKLSFGQKISLLMYLLVSAVGKLCIFTRPFFAIADENIAKMISETRDFCISEAFHGINDPKKYLGLLCTYLVKDLMICAYSLIGLIPMLLYRTIGVTPNQFMQLIFKIAHISIAILSIIFVSLEYSAVGYVGANLKDAEASDIMFLARSQIKGQKGKVFLSSFLHWLIVYPLTFFALLGICVINDLGTQIWFPLFGVLVLLILFLVNITIFNKVALQFMTVRYEVYKDNISLKKPVVIKEIAGEEEAYVSLYRDEERDLEAINISQMKKKESK